MGIFTYRAKNLSGKEISGKREAGSLKDLSSLLKQGGYTLLDASEISSTSTPMQKGGVVEGLGKKISSISIFRRVKLTDRMIFSRNLSVMIGAGLPLARALEALSRETKNNYFKQVILDISARVKQGKTLKECFESHPEVFSSLYVSMVEAGEKSGKLEESLNLLSNQMKKDHELIKRVRGAMTYPAIVLTIMILIGIIMLVYVVPTLESTFTELGLELPQTTQVILDLSNFVTKHPIPVIIFIPFFFGSLIASFRTRGGKRVLDFIIVKIPVIGNLAQQFNTARTARTLSSLISSGVPITESLSITANVLQNHYYKEILLEARSAIEKGRTMGETFTRYPKLYSPLMGEMVAVGEETGKISDMLGEISDFYEGEVDAATKDLSSFVEPVLMVIIGLMVGVFAFAMFTPLYSTIGNI